MLPRYELFVNDIVVFSEAAIFYAVLVDVACSVTV